MVRGRIVLTDVTLIPGDGIGPEVVGAARRVLDAATSRITWDLIDAGELAYQRHGVAVPDELVRSLQRTKVGLKGPMTVPPSGYTSPSTEIRRAVGLWCNVRFAVVMPGVPSRFTGTDIVIIRDITEDINRGVQQQVGPDAGIGIKFVTRAAATRLAEFGFTYATRLGRTRVTVPSQASIQRTTDGLFDDAIRSVARKFPTLPVDMEAMDSLAMHLVTRPEEYDVLLCPYFYGGVLGGLCAGISGGVGLMPGFNSGDEGRIVFEAGHGSAPKYAGQNKVNPTGVILAGALLLDHIGDPQAADRVRRAVRKVIADGTFVTYDLGGRSGTSQMADAVVRELT